MIEYLLYLLGEFVNLVIKVGIDSLLGSVQFSELRGI